MFFNTPEEGNDVESKFEIIPKGRHRLVVIDSDYTPNKNETGKVMKVVSEVVDGPAKGKRLFSFFNLEHNSQKAKQIGRAEFKSFLSSLRIEEAINDVQECHQKIANKIFVAEIDHENGYATATEYFRDQGTPAPHQASKASGAASSSNDLDTIPF